MIGNWLEGVAPKAGLAGFAVWGAINYLVLGPEIGSRTIRADHLPACRAGFSGSIKRQAEQLVQSIPRPRLDPVKEAAVERGRQMMKSPFAQQFLNGPLGGMLAVDPNSAFAAYEQEKAEMQAAYRRAVDQVNAATAVKIGKADDFCSCVGDRVIELARSELALWTGTLGVIRPAKIKDLSVSMAQVSAAGACNGYGGAS